MLKSTHYLRSFLSDPDLTDLSSLQNALGMSSSGGAAGFYSVGPISMSHNDERSLNVGAAALPLVNSWVMEEQPASTGNTTDWAVSNTSAFTEEDSSKTEFVGSSRIRLQETQTNTPVLLMHFNDESGTTTFIDALGHVVTRNGSPVLANSVAGYYGNAYGSFDGTEGQYLSVASHADFAIGTGSVTFEFRMRSASDQTGKRRYLLRDGTVDSEIEVGITVGPSNVADWSNGGGYIGIHISYHGVSWGTQMASTSDVCDGNWHHIALTRNSANNVWTLYVDGVSEATTTYSYNVAQGHINIGGTSYPGDSRTFQGQLDQVAICRSLVYSGNFTPATDQLNYVSYPHGDYYHVRIADLSMLVASMASSITSLTITQTVYTLTAIKWLYTTDGGTTWKDHAGTAVALADIGTGGSTAAQMSTLFTNWTPPSGATSIGLAFGLYAQNFTLTPFVSSVQFTYNGPIYWNRNTSDYTFEMYTGSPGSVRFTKTSSGTKTVHLVAINGN